MSAGLDEIVTAIDGTAPPVLRLGDCLSTLRDLPTASFGAVVTDPPYTAAGGSTNGRSGGNLADSQFFSFWLRSVFAEVRRVVRPDGCGFIFCDWRTVGIVADAMMPDGNRQTEETWRVGQALVWDRESIGLGSPFRNSFEMIAFVRGPAYRSDLPKDIPTVVRHRWPYGKHVHHGAEKPLDLVKQLVRWTRAGPVLDPFMGSGTTILACAELGVSATGIELAAASYEVAATRLAAHHPAVDPAVRGVRLADGRCPECGSPVEWRLHSSRPGDRSRADCIWSGRAYLPDRQASEFDAGRRCTWTGWAVRGERGETRLVDQCNRPAQTDGGR